MKENIRTIRHTYSWRAKSEFDKEITEIWVKEGAIPRAITTEENGKIEHDFDNMELSKMYQVANPLEKMMLGCGFEWGQRTNQLASIKRSIVKKSFVLLTEKETVTAHLGSTDALLTDIELAHKFLGSNTEWLFPNSSNGEHLSDQHFNDVLRDLMKRAMVEPRGWVHWTCLRKWLQTVMETTCGFTQGEIDYYIGKATDKSKETYKQRKGKVALENFEEKYQKLEAIFNDIRTVKPAMNETQYFKAIQWIIEQLRK